MYADVNSLGGPGITGERGDDVAPSELRLGPTGGQTQW